MREQKYESQQDNLAAVDEDPLSEILAVINKHGSRITNEGLRIPREFLFGIYGPVTLVDGREGFDWDDGFRDVRKSALLEIGAEARSIVLIPFGDSGLIRTSSRLHGTSQAIHLLRRCFEGGVLVILVKETKLKSWADAVLTYFGSHASIEYYGSPGAGVVGLALGGR